MQGRKCPFPSKRAYISKDIENPVHFHFPLLASTTDFCSSLSINSKSCGHLHSFVIQCSFLKKVSSAQCASHTVQQSHSGGGWHFRCQSCACAMTSQPQLEGRWRESCYPGFRFSAAWALGASWLNPGEKRLQGSADTLPQTLFLRPIYLRHRGSHTSQDAVMGEAKPAPFFCSCLGEFLVDREMRAGGRQHLAVL